jgi:ribosomal protein S18 acetylase RimI-like enzyme
MKTIIRPYAENDLDAIVALSLLAWEPVFESFQRIFSPAIYEILYPDWRKSQAEGVVEVCKDGGRYITLVAQAAGEVVGFISYQLKSEEKRGEVVLLAVDPDHQNRGTGTALNLAALKEIEAAGMTMAIVETGGDESHAPARRSYEKAGYTAMPITRYFKRLNMDD